VPLAEELRLLRVYPAIQQTRYGERLRIGVDVDEGCEQILVPTLILQPLVENAIRHGFGMTPGPGTIAIRVSIEPGPSTESGAARLRIDVTDEGAGPPEPRREGYGLRNTQSRLLALYADAARVSVVPREPRGARTRLERRLDPARFVRIHRSTIVNVDKVTEMRPAFHGEYEVILTTGRRLRCSRTYAAALVRVLGS
jgi:LytS/YehU family sensor histidine kinase